MINVIYLFLKEDRFAVVQQRVCKYVFFIDFVANRIMFCLKYKCYFSNEKTDSNSTMKLYDIKNYGLDKSKQNES